MKLTSVINKLAIASLLLPMAWSGNVIAGKTADVAILVNTMGYGAGIHRFKDYVLAADAGHKAVAAASFDKTKKALISLSKDTLDAEEKKAVADVGAVVDKYIAALATVEKMSAQKKTAQQIDAVVKIDDSPAINGMQVLIKHVPTAISKVEFSLGFGRAVHQYKNYVLRGKAKHGANATKFFNAAAKDVASLSDATTKKAVGAMINDYLAAIKKVDVMVAAKKTPEQIDAAIKIDDEMAISALESAATSASM